MQRELKKIVKKTTDSLQKSKSQLQQFGSSPLGGWGGLLILFALRFGILLACLAKKRRYLATKKALGFLANIKKVQMI